MNNNLFRTVNVMGNGQKINAEGTEVMLGFGWVRRIPGQIRKLPKAFLWTAGAALLTLLVVAAVRANTMHVGYTHILDEICATVNDRNSDLDAIAESLLPNFAEEYYDIIMDAIGGMGIVESELDATEDGIMEAYLELEDEFGRDAEVSWKVLEKEEMSAFQMRRVGKAYGEFAEEYLQKVLDKLDNTDRIRSLADRFDLSRSDIRDVLGCVEDLSRDCEHLEIERGYHLVLELAAEGSEDEDSTEVEVNVIYANGEWMLDYSDLNEVNVLTAVGEEVDSILWWL